MIKKQHTYSIQIHRIPRTIDADINKKPIINQV